MVCHKVISTCILSHHQGPDVDDVQPYRLPDVRRYAGPRQSLCHMRVDDDHVRKSGGGRAVFRATSGTCPGRRGGSMAWSPEEENARYVRARQHDLANG
jgi:hypothetical protein